MASTVWRGFVTFGLISIPVRLFRAARAERISLRRVQRVPTRTAQDLVAEEPSRRTEPSSYEGSLKAAPLRAVAFNTGRENVWGSDAPTAARPVEDDAQESVPSFRPVKQAVVSADPGEEVVPAREVVKAYEYEKDRFVELTPDELKSLVRKTATEMEIQEFVKLSDIDPVYFETSYYVVPEEAGAKAYALLYRSMADSGLVAVSQLAMHGREHAVILRSGKSGLLAHTMFYSSEVHADEEYRADTHQVSSKELELAQTLIGSLTSSFEPERYRDTYQEQLEQLIARKVAGQPAVSAEPVVKASSVIDITEALQRSLAALKKPPASDTDTADKQATSRPRRKRAPSAG